MTLEELEKIKKELEIEIEKIEEQIHKTIIEDYAINIGDIVINDGKEVKVTFISASSRKPWLWGVSKNKNGEWGVRNVCLYDDWELK